jgi:sigma-B regulation protein RsbU (phosphoserine phosphatase)
MLRSTEVLNTDMLRGMKSLVDALRVGSVSLDLEETLKAILDGLKSIIDYDAAAIYLVEPGSGQLRSQIVRGYPDEVLKFEPIPKGKGVIGRVLEAGSPVLISDVAVDPNHVEARWSRRSEMATPIVGSSENLIGVLNLESDRTEAYDPIALELLTLFASGVAVAIEKATLHAELMKKRRLESELAMARRVMENLLPRKTPQIAGLDIAALNQPWSEIGGDYYDFIPIDSERWGIAIGDVAGKGASAALLVSALRASLHSLARNELALRSIFRKAHRFFQESFADGDFVTLFYAEMDVSVGRLIYINAGHPPPLLIHQNGAIEFLENGGLPLGLLEADRYGEGVADFGEGDALVLYTDGISEALNASDEPYGRERLVAAISRLISENAASVSKAVMEDVEHFSESQISDDRTLVVLKSR